MIIELHISGELRHRIEVPDNSVNRKYDRFDRSTKQDYIHHAMMRLKRIGEAQLEPWEIFIYKPSKLNSWGRPRASAPPVVRPEGKYSNTQFV